MIRRRVVLVGAVLLGSVACSDNATAPGGGVGLALTPADVFIEPGQRAPLLVAGAAAGATAAFATADGAVATVAGTGLSAEVIGVADGDTTVTATVGSTVLTARVRVGTVSLTAPTRQQVADLLTAQAALGNVSATVTPKPVDLGPDDALAATLQAELGGGQMLVGHVDPAALAANPPQIGPGQIAFSATGTGRASRGTATPDPKLAESINKLLDELTSLGIDTTALKDAAANTSFHQQGSQAGGVTVDPTADAVTFIPNSLGYSITFYNGFVVFVYDGNAHTVFKDQDAADLRDGKLFEDNSLTTAASTALHELTHTALKRQGLAGFDDDGDALVAQLESLLRARVRLELQRKASGAPAPSTVVQYSAALAQVLELNGGQQVLDKFGYATAGALAVTAPTEVSAGAAFTVAVKLTKADGTPLAGQDVVIGVQGATTTAGSQVVRTDAGGNASIQATAGAEAGEIRLVTQTAGKEDRRVVQVKVGARVGVLLQHPLGQAFAAGTFLELERISNDRIGGAEAGCSSTHLHAASDAGIMVDGTVGPFPDPDPTGCGYGSISAQ